MKKAAYRRSVMVKLLVVLVMLFCGVSTPAAQAHESAAHRVARITIELDPHACYGVLEAIKDVGYLRAEKVFAKEYGYGRRPGAIAVFAELAAQCGRLH
jgi:hypothetical protein